MSIIYTLRSRSYKCYKVIEGEKEEKKNELEVDLNKFRD